VHLTIRGPATSSYAHQLLSLARKAGVEGRVRLAPPVVVPDLVSSAAAHDVGLFVLEGDKRQNDFVLPNKVFEYLMAGLALCISDLPEMARLVTETKAGVLVPQAEPAAIANAINGLDRSRIDEYKRHALAAARELNWERESAKLLTVVDHALARKRA
jgi:glycosyltransferase involved in cell wall biosynthesis